MKFFKLPIPCWLRRVLVTSEKDNKGLRSERSLPPPLLPPLLPPCCCWCMMTSCCCCCCCCCDWPQELCVALPPAQCCCCCCWSDDGCCCCCCCCTDGQHGPPAWRHCCWKGRDSVQRPIHRSSASFVTLALKLPRAKFKNSDQKFSFATKSKKESRKNACQNKSETEIFKRTDIPC